MFCHHDYIDFLLFKVYVIQMSADHLHLNENTSTNDVMIQLYKSKCGLGFYSVSSAGFCFKPTGKQQRAILYTISFLHSLRCTEWIRGINGIRATKHRDNPVKPSRPRLQQFKCVRFQLSLLGLPTLRIMYTRISLLLFLTFSSFECCL